MLSTSRFKVGLGTGESEISERSLQFGRLTSTGPWTTVVSMICRTRFLDVWCSKGHGDVSVMYKGVLKLSIAEG